MCGRYTFFDVAELYERFGVNNRIENLIPRYNVSPGSLMPVIVKQSPVSAKMMRWGLIPFWASDPKIGYRMINARRETLLTKPSYRKPLIRGRCLIPANGFYEWEKAETKQPYYFKAADGQIFAFAGLFDTWKDAENVEIQTFTIITTAATGAIKQIHDRMPVILDKTREAAWIDPDLTVPDKILDLLDNNLSPIEGYPVDKRVNHAREDNEKLIEPIKT